MEPEQLKELYGELIKAQGSSDWLQESLIVPKIWKLINPVKRRNKTTRLESPLLRFLDKVSFGTGDCWYWRASIDPIGYGTIGTSKAHRFSWRLFKGEIPAGISVLHKCDIRNCVNPDHLFLGTQKDNMADCARKGRMNTWDHPGEKNPSAKLTNEEVLEMRKLFDDGMSPKEIAKEFGVSVMTAFRAATKRSWSHI